jgi:hypothetical protein
MLILPEYIPTADVLFLSEDIEPYPVSLLYSHLWARGASRSGKTALLAHIANQLIELAGYFRHVSIIIADCKGDDALFNEARETAAQWGLPFKDLNSRPGFATFPFNPIQQSFITCKPAVYRSEAIAECLGVTYGQHYGASHYGAINERAFREAFSIRNPPLSLAELHQYFLLRPSKAGGKFGPVHAMNEVDKLAQLSFLNQTGRGGIDIAEMFLPGNPQVLYAYLPADELATANFAIVRMLLYTAYTVAQEHLYPGGLRNGLIFICDEVQNVVSSTVLRLLDMARSRRVGLVFAHQNRAQLNQISPDAGSLFYNGFGTHIHFTPANQPDSEEFSSSETYFHRFDLRSRGSSITRTRGFSGPNRTGSTSFSESENHSEQFVERPVFHMNRLNAITDEPNRFLFRVSQQHPLFPNTGRYFVGDRWFHVEPHVYKLRSETPPPREPFAEGMIINQLAEPAPEVPPDVAEAPQASPGSKSVTMKLSSPLSRALFGSGQRAARFLATVPRLHTSR